MGAILGIGTASFIVFDRLYRDRPIFAPHVKSPSGSVGGRENDVYLRIKNVTDEDIVIDDVAITQVPLTEERSAISRSSPQSPKQLAQQCGFAFVIG